jgi:hypothetical protein
MKAMFGTRHPPVQRKASRTSSARSYTSSESSDNLRQKAHQVETMLGSLGPMLGPAPAKAKVNQVKGMLDELGPQRHRSPSGHSPASPWNAPRRVAAKVDPDEEFVSFTRSSSPPMDIGIPIPLHDDRRQLLDAVGFPTHLMPPPMHHAAASMDRHQHPTRLTRKASAEPVAGRFAPRPDLNTSAAQLVYEHARSRSKSVGAHSHPTPPDRHAPPVPFVPSRPPREEAKELSFFENDWTDDPFARLSPAHVLPPPPPPAEVPRYLDTAPTSPVKRPTLASKKSMPNLEGVWQEFLVEASGNTSEDVGIVPSPPKAPYSETSGPKRGHPAALARSISANAVDVAAPYETRGTPVARRAHSHQALALRAHAKAPRHSSSTTDLSDSASSHASSGRWRSGSQSTSTSRISGSTCPTPPADDYPRSVSVLDALDHLTAVEEEFHLAAFPPDEHANPTPDFPTLALSIPTQKSPPVVANAARRQPSAERLLPPIITNVALRTPLATPPLESALSQGSSRSEESQMASPFTPQSSRLGRGFISAPSPSAPPANFYRPTHTLPRATHPPHGPLPQPPDLDMPARSEHSLVVRVRPRSPRSNQPSRAEAASSARSNSPDTFPSHSSRKPSPGSEDGTTEHPSGSPLSPTMQALISADLHKSGSLSKIRRQQRRETPSPTSLTPEELDDRSSTPLGSNDHIVQWGYAV